MTNRPRLLFVSTRFLFPTDTGGQIRTNQILRGMKGGRFNITLASPAPPDALARYGTEIASVSDRFVSWPEKRRSAFSAITRMRHIISSRPIPVVTDWLETAQKIVNEELMGWQDIVIFDFPHAAILAPKKLSVRSVLFTHNVEAEIFLRHLEIATNPLKKFIWNNQYKKMKIYEGEVVSRFDTVVAVSERDRKALMQDYGIANVHVIRTGVDLDYFNYEVPADTKNIVFTGSMDWIANIDGIEYFLGKVWPLIAREEPKARMTVVGRNPPANLCDKAIGVNWNFTGFVGDVRPYIRQASVYVIPLRVGGGTRLKVFEAMASGCPVVSTTIGVEGLPLTDGEHFLRADSPSEIAEAVMKLLVDRQLRERLSTNARKYVENNFSFTRTAREFEDICANVLEHFGQADR